MAYSVNKLIANAFYLSRVRSSDFQQVSGSDIAIGLDLLNEVLSETSVNTRMIPYYKEYVTNAVVGQEMYFIPGLVEPFSLTFNLSTVRFSTNDLSRRQYHSVTRIDGISALPINCSFELTTGGSNLYVYFLPSTEYPFKIWGKFSLKCDLGQTDLTTDMLLTYDLFYIRYLRHLLAAEICNYYGTTLSPDVRVISERIAANINDKNVLDLTSRKVNLYSDEKHWDWPSVNLFRGFTA